jgi:putative peptide zinc metalloprotease protein
MRFGPSGLRASPVLAKGLHRPKLRSDLRISKQNIVGEISYVVKIAETSSYRRYGEYEFELLEACDGTRTAAEVATFMTERHPGAPVDEAAVLEFLDEVEPEIWERTVGEKNLAILERLRDERKGRLDQSSLLYITFKAWDPNKTLARLDPWLSWMYTRAFVYFSVALFIFTLWLLAGDWGRIATDTKDLWNFSNKSAYDLWLFWILLLVLGCIHEMGHGLTCKHYGGDVHQMGFILIYLTPAFFTDTTDILLMDRVAPRQWTIFAGIWVELVVFGLSAILWHVTLPGSSISNVAYKMMLLAGLQGTILNLNPLIKADGYYALCQHLQLDNLREDAFAFLKGGLRKYILRSNVELPQATRREKRIFVTFSLLALVYSTALITIVLLWVRNMCVNKFGAWGYAVFGALIYFFLRKKLRKASRALRDGWNRGKEKYMAWKLTRTQVAAFAAVAALIAIPPVPSKVATPFVLEPASQANAHAAVPGIMQQVLVKQGDVVQQGQVLAVMQNPFLEESVAANRQQLALAQSRFRAAEANGNLAVANSAGSEAARLEQSLAEAKRKFDQLEIRAPIAGVVATPELLETAGEHFTAGEIFCHISSRARMRARILVRDWEMSDVHPGARVLLKAAPYPYRTYAGRVERIMPAAAPDQPVSNPVVLARNGQQLTNYVAVIADFSNPDNSLREGMTGTAKIYSAPRPIGWQIARGTWRWVRSQVW